MTKTKTILRPAGSQVPNDNGRMQKRMYAGDVIRVGDVEIEATRVGQRSEITVSAPRSVKIESISGGQNGKEE